MRANNKSGTKISVNIRGMVIKVHSEGKRFEKISEIASGPRSFVQYECVVKTYKHTNWNIRN